MKAKANIIAGALIGAIFIWLAFRGTDFSTLGSSFRSADYRYLVPAVLLSVMVQLVRSYRWGVILEPLKKIDQWSLLSATSVGFMAISLLPVRMGEFVRPYLISKKSDIRLGASLATIVVERVFDMLTLMIMLLLVILSSRSKLIELPPWISEASYIILLITIPMLLLLVFAAVKRDVAAQGIDFLIKLLPHALAGRLSRLVHSFLDGLQILPDWRKTAYLALLSLVTWFFIGLINYALFKSFTSMSHLTLPAAYTVLLITALGITLPTAPGFVGNYHYFCVLGLALFGIAKADALTYAILLHGLQFLVIIVLGLIFIPFIKVPLPAIFKSSSESAP
jgi:uncharacterized protein (TIRG00374 family)